MKNVLLFLILSIYITNGYGQVNQKIEYQKAFAKVYGYVKYFHPSDEASNIDWDKFAIYGSSQVEKCKSDEELLDTFTRVFNPIAPSIQFYSAEEPIDYDFKAITPKDLENYKLAYWQHKGVSFGMINNGKPYSSIRVNRSFEIDKSSSIGNIMTAIEGSRYSGKEFKYSAWVKLADGSQGTGHLWFRVDKTDGATGFFANMANSPITDSNWQRYEITGTVDSLPSRLAFGCFLMGKGKLLLDDIELSFKENGNWMPIPLKNNGFEGSGIKDENQWGTSGLGFTFNTSETDKNTGRKSAIIQYQGATEKGFGKKLFDDQPEFGELITKKIHKNIYCKVPLVVYGTEEFTYPQSNKKNLSSLVNNINGASTSNTDLALRLGNIINVYNVFQHFYPYFNEVKVDWEKELEKALVRCYSDKTEKDHLITLQKFTASLKDGHIGVSSTNMDRFVPPISWEWIENKLIITEIHADVDGLAIGDEVLKIDGKNSVDYFDEIYSRISAGTDGWLKFRAQSEGLYGPKDSKLVITLKDKILELTRDKDIYTANRQNSGLKAPYKEINNNVFYLNLDRVNMDTINTLLPKIKDYPSIIFDLRGYPNRNHGIISHLLKTNDSTEGWMQVPRIIYPDQENIVSWEKMGWKLQSAKPYLGDKKIIFITDGRAISYAESFMGYIEGYKLGTIVGQPTAGTNGNVNPFKLPGGYTLNWTGMKVTKHDGSQHHGVGVIPNIYVSKTIKGVKSGKDEFLEKAIELTEK